MQSVCAHCVRVRALRRERARVFNGGCGARTCARGRRGEKERKRQEEPARPHERVLAHLASCHLELETRGRGFAGLSFPRPRFAAASQRTCKRRQLLSLSPLETHLFCKYIKREAANELLSPSELQGPLFKNIDILLCAIPPQTESTANLTVFHSLNITRWRYLNCRARREHRGS